MANKKFSQFNNELDINNFDGVVGYAGANNLRISGADLNQSLDINSLAGTAAIASGGTGSSVAGVATVGALLDEASQVVGDSLIIEDNAGASVLATGAAVNIRPPALQLKISGTAGLGNTTNGVDFKVPYNTQVVNTDTSTFNPTLTGGMSVQGSVIIQKAGRYLIQVRYSTFDLVQSSLPTIDGTKFLRITASLNGVKTCVLNNLLISTSVNGEAVATGTAIMDFAASDVFFVTGFHTGATGGSGNQGFPVSNNTLFNEPMLWMIKIG